MNTDKEKLLNETYTNYMALLLGDYPLENIEELAVPDVTGYGTALDEKILDIQRLRKLVVDQREQGKGIEMQFDIQPVHRRIIPEKDTAIFIDEVQISMFANGEKNVIPLRLSSVFELIDDKWKVIHMHGSQAVAVEGDTWHLDEWKQKTEKLEKMVDEQTTELLEKNKELEIAASLERVRAVAMGMSKSEDLMSICKVSYHELEKLGFNNLRAVLIHILDDEKRTFTDYDYCELYGGEVSNLSYDSHPQVVDFFNQIKSAKDAFAEAVFTGEELESWKKVRLETGQKNDPRLNNANALYYYGYSIGIGDFTISTLNPIDEYKRKILKRFRNVFELAYKRYLDIKNAEAQAREAQIEAALERVRAKAMAMNSTEDLTQTADTFFSELVKLNITPHRCGFGIVDKETRIADIHATTATEDKSLKIVTGKLKLDDHPILEKIFEGYQKQEEYHPVLRGKEISDYYEVMNPQVEFPDFSDDEVQYGYYFYFKEGGVFAWNDEKFTANELEIFRRYTSVLSLTYRRYIDLKEAEVQAREARIEASLERVRSRAMAMRSSDELIEVASELRNQMGVLGQKDLEVCAIHLYELEDDYFESWGAMRAPGEDGKLFQGQAKFPKSGIKIVDEMMQNYSAGKKNYILLNDGEKGYEWLEAMKQYSPDAYAMIAHTIENTPPEKMRAYWSVSDFDGGALVMVTYIEPDESSRNLLRRAASVFGLAYRRYLDLKTAEAQAREAQIEAALERVRSLAVGMQQSDEVGKVSDALFSELQKLSVKVVGCTISVIDEKEDKMELWRARPTAAVNAFEKSSFTNSMSALKKNIPNMYNSFLNSWKSKAKHLVAHHSVEERNQLLNTIIELYNYDAEQKKKLYNSIPDEVVSHYIFFKIGYLALLAKDRLSDEELSIARRFIEVFDFAYTRFYDLKKAEIQNNIIQAENDRKTQELEEARQLQLAMLPKEVPTLSKLDIAVFMQTATEVGGDYYDFSTKDDGSLNICLGDATGHGLKAGTLVSMMKSLFVSDSIRLGVKEFFVASNETLKKMSLNKMMMAFAMINIYGHKIKISSAGIPPIYIFRKEQNIVEEVNLNGLPIGAMKNARYDIYSSELSKGDTILMMSDGMPELQNIDDEMYGYDRLIELFGKKASKSSEEIIEDLKNEFEEWAGERDPDDDITFVVVKVK